MAFVYLPSFLPYKYFPLTSRNYFALFIISYGLVYVILTTLPAIYKGIYGESVGIAGLHYLALGVGVTGSSQINARLFDRIYKYFKEKNGGHGKPEFRLRKLALCPGFCRN